jgi:hypothetical protein
MPRTIASCKESMGIGSWNRLGKVGWMMVWGPDGDERDKK